MNTFTERLIDALKRLLTSAKVITALAGMLAAFAAKHNIVLAPEDVTTIITIFGVLIGAQGLNDFGKGQAQIKADNPPPPDTVQSQVVNVGKDETGQRRTP